MDAWRVIRLKARACHNKALAKSKEGRKPRALLDAAREEDDLTIVSYEPGSVVSKNVLGLLDRESKVINIAKGQEPEDEVVVIAHELGHFHLHTDPRNEVTSHSQGLGGDPIDSGAGRVEGYSPRERKEIQADIFAGEFLCPTDWMKNEIKKGRKPREIANDLGLPPSLVLNQAIRATLLPPLRELPPKAPTEKIQLDSSQHQAAMWASGPLLVDAGPGTGKTRTLVTRVRHLLDNGAPSASILALTFSNKAAEEMYERLTLSDADAAIEMWVSTFHAFGKELITKYHALVKRTVNFRTLDEAGSLQILEDNLERLPLRHYQNLYEPAYELVHIYRAISRCKDELINPSQYRAAAEASHAAAKTDDAVEAAGKMLEIAAVYEIYQEALDEADAVDFGDLISLSVAALDGNEALRRTYQEKYEHILVDEYQDVNYASARLLRALCRPGADVWVVADQRQSIYRFRGAAPSNVTKFNADFGGNRVSLGTNYRSGAPVVRIFQTFAATMQSSPGGSWVPRRGAVGAVEQFVGPTVVDEAQAIHANIEKARAAGIAYADQVILARSHLTLARITGVLERLGVPLLYLGDLFEREEVRDLLSLGSIDAERGGIGLVRVAALPEYQVPKQDVLTLIRWAEENDKLVFEALQAVPDIQGLSDAGRAGLARLGKQLAGFSPATSPWALLTEWLFERCDYLRPLFMTEDAKSQQKRIAIYQLLKVCGEMASLSSRSNFSRRPFLDRIRRIEALNDDRIYRAVASEASDMDGVRVMTIHGSKGLEFRSVHLPALATRYMPASRQAVRCPAPANLPQLAVQPADHEAEEECLFFVALSRAQDLLFLTRAEQYGPVQKASASKFLNSINGIAPPRQSRSRSVSQAKSRPNHPQAPKETYQERELGLYLQCAQRYQFEALDGLRAMRGNAPYIRFHACVFQTIAWLEQQRSAGIIATHADADKQLAVHWDAIGPYGGNVAYYRASAEGMVATMVDIIANETGTYDDGEWLVELKGKKILLKPDRVVIGANGLVRVQRVRTGRKTKSEADNRIYALLRRGAAMRYAGKRVSIETLYLATRESVPVSPGDDDKSLREYTDTIAAIERGAFAPKPKDSRTCPNCQCYFICDFVQGVST